MKYLCLKMLLKVFPAVKIYVDVFYDKKMIIDKAIVYYFIIFML